MNERDRNLAVRRFYLRHRCGVGGVRAANDEREGRPQPGLFDGTDACDRPIDDVRRVALCVRHGRRV